MQIPKKCACLMGTFFLVFIIAPHPAVGIIEDVLDIIHVVKEVTTGVLKAWDIVQQSPLGQNIEFPLMREKQRKVLTRIKEISRQIDQTEEKYATNVALAIESISDFMTTNTPLISRMNDISDISNEITSRFQQMKQYETHQSKLEIKTLITFAEWAVLPNHHSVSILMKRMHLILFGSEDKDNKTMNMLSILEKNYEEAAVQICQTQQSAQQFVYSLYADIAMTELKGYIMMEFSWMMLRIHGKGNFTQEAELMRSDYEKRTERTLKLLREVMRDADRILWRCDPPKHEKGKTYDEVTRLLQGYVENEVDLNRDETCREDCAFYQSSKSEGCFKEKFCARQPKCSGKIYHCTFVDSDMWVCPSSYNSSRRYEYIEYENGRVFGKKTYCARGATKVDSWWRYLFWHCSYCFCLCDQTGRESDRYFSLRESLSDVNNNKVIVGLRFIKKNRVFHLQIQEGELLPRGSINASTISWKPVDVYNIYDRDVHNGIDYHTLSYESRSIDLDDIQTTDIANVVTGVRFRIVGAHLNLECRLSEFNFEMGKLVKPELYSFWDSNDSTDVSGKRREKIKLNEPDVSTKSIVRSRPDSRHNQYIDFENTNMDKDAAQTTVPFIDLQDVFSNPPVPLSGVGIYHKGYPGYGGFLAPKIITYDFTSHVKPPRKDKEIS